MVLDLSQQNISPTKNEIDFKREEEIAILNRNQKGWSVELNRISYNGKPAVYDLRSWSPEGTMGKGITLTNQTIKNLHLALDSYFGPIPQAPVEEQVQEETNKELESGIDNPESASTEIPVFQPNNF